MAKKRYFAVVVMCVIYILLSNIFASEESFEAEVIFLPDREFPVYLISDIKSADSSIYCAMYMFSEGDGVPGEIYSALTQAASSGVYVQIFLDNSGDFQYNAAIGEKLTSGGVNVLFGERERRMHSKICTIDGVITYIGSHNFTQGAMSFNSEATVRISSAEVSKKAESYIGSALLLK